MCTDAHSDHSCADRARDEHTPCHIRPPHPGTRSAYAHSARLTHNSASRSAPDAPGTAFSAASLPAALRHRPGARARPPAHRRFGQEPLAARSRHRRPLARDRQSPARSPGQCAEALRATIAETGVLARRPCRYAAAAIPDGPGIRGARLAAPSQAIRRAGQGPLSSTALSDRYRTKHHPDHTQENRQHRQVMPKPHLTPPNSTAEVPTPKRTPDKEVAQRPLHRV
jgi:hypothetical protein